MTTLSKHYYNSLETEIKDLNFNIQVLSMESMGSGGIMEFFNRNFEALKSRIKNGFSMFNTFKEEPDYRDLEADMDSAKYAHKERRYIYFKDMLVQIPEGFKGELDEYGSTLLALSEELEIKKKKLFSMYKALLSNYVNEETYFYQFKDSTVLYKEFASHREEIKDVLSDYFDSNLKSREYLLKVVPRYADLVKCADIVKKLVFTVKVKEITKDVKDINEISTMLDAVEKKLLTLDKTKLTKEAALNIAEGAREVAEYVEQIVAFHYCVISYISTIKLIAKSVISNEQ